MNNAKQLCTDNIIVKELPYTFYLHYNSSIEKLLSEFSRNIPEIQHKDPKILQPMKNYLKDLVTFSIFIHYETRLLNCEKYSYWKVNDINEPEVYFFEKNRDGESSAAKYFVFKFVTRPSEYSPYFALFEEHSKFKEIIKAARAIPDFLIKVFERDRRTALQIFVEKIRNEYTHNDDIAKRVLMLSSTAPRSNRDSFISQLEMTVNHLQSCGKKITKKNVYEAMGIKKSSFDDLLKPNKFNIGFDKQLGKFIY